MQSLLHLIYPPQCITCDEMLSEEFSLCAGCWGETPFIAGHICDTCGAPLPGEGDERRDLCDDCMTIARPWTRGRAALIYRDNARNIVLSLKHGDRTDLAKPAAKWMHVAGADLFGGNPILVPIPVHWTRLFRRRYNQAALLAQQLARLTGCDFVPDALVRTRRTAPHDGMGLDQRFQNMAGAIAPHPSRGRMLEGKNILLIDDVMTSGATLAAATEACEAGGATQVCVLTLARVAKDT